MSYSELIITDPPMPKGCFFAFNQKQYNEGVLKNELNKDDVCSYGYGLYGTIEAVNAFMKGYEDRAERIKKECTPQEVYEYEYDNHECGYVCDDTEAIECCLAYFSLEDCNAINRRHACQTIEEIQKQMKR